METNGRKGIVIGVAVALLATTVVLAQVRKNEMSFFVTSSGLGDGANLGGLKGADRHCQRLASAAGADDRTWVAYLSSQGENAIHARDRIGPGPWFNANGVSIAENIDDLHREDVNLDHETALDENGAVVPHVHRDDQGAAIPPSEQPAPVEHDILTGSQADGTAFPPGEDRTCATWTSNGEGSAMLGHHDRRSLQPGISSWNAAHPSRGCSQESLVGTGGAGRFYCFATN